MKHTDLTASLLTFFLAAACPATAQYAWQQDGMAGKLDLLKDVGYKAGIEATASDNRTPLWLNANRHGMSSLDKRYGYVRAAVERPLNADSARRWGVGYGVDAAVGFNMASTLMLQQAYIEGRWLHGVLTIGAKVFPMELKNERLSSGSQTMGINARPIPQIRLALPRYWTVPGFKRWLHVKGHIAYGHYTDDSWQKDFTKQKNSWTTGTHFHSKAGYLMIGSPERFVPWSMELGLEMVCQFGGTNHTTNADGTVTTTTAGASLKDYYNAFIPGGQDAADGMYGNIEGNQLGSWVARLNYDGESWAAHIYADHFFEDHSQMFLLDYDGYGTGSEWNTKKDHRFFMYKLKDMMLGAEVNLKNGRWLRNIVFEYLYTKYQSGPINHDHTQNIPDHQAGMDQYYNHSFYQAYQHWGQVIGNPLFRSPIYNDDGTISVKDNRFMAFHLGIDGRPCEQLAYRLLATYQEGLGRYTDPFLKLRRSANVMAEATYVFPHGWKARAAYAMDFGSRLMYGHNAGFQIAVTKEGILKLRKKK